MFERMAAGWRLATSSWQVLINNKRLMVFPLLSGLCCILVTITFFVPMALLVNWRQLGDDGQVAVQWWHYVVLFAFYFVNYFVIIFFNSALVGCAVMEFNGERATVSDGLTLASSRLPQILAWALVSATVGILLKLIENAHEKIGAIVSAILGTAWSIMTFFVVPVLVVEKLGPIDAVKRSMSLLRKSWGEALVGNFSLGLFSLLLALPGILLLVVGGYLLTGGALAAVGVAFVILGVVALIIAGTASSALSGIFLAAVYEYAAYQTVPPAFDRSDIEQAFRTK